MKRTCSMVVVVLLTLVIGVGGVMAKDEKVVVTQTAFTKIDTNGDGVITVAEYGAYWKGRFKDIDANKDGKLMADEFEKATKQSFASADTSKDNVLVAQEYVVYWCGSEAKAPKKVKGEPQKEIDANKDGKIDNDECVVMWLTRFNDMDTNKDDRVTMDEFMTAMKKQFKALDKNGDGYIAVEEYDYYWSPKPATPKK